VTQIYNIFVWMTHRITMIISKMTVNGTVFTTEYDYKTTESFHAALHECKERLYVYAFISK